MYKSIFLIGPMGAGKTTVGKKLSELLRYDFIDCDLLLETRVGCSIKELIIANGDAYFRALESEIIKELSTLEKTIIATGGGAVLNPNSCRLLQNAGIVCYLKVTLEQQVQRLLLDNKRALLPEDSVTRLVFLQQMIIQRESLYNSVANITLDTSNSTPENIINKLAKEIAKSHA